MYTAGEDLRNRSEAAEFLMEEQKETISTITADIKGLNDRLAKTDKATIIAQIEA